MKIRDIVYFAPHIPIGALRVDHDSIVDALCARFTGFYLEPAAEANERERAFAAGLILTCCIDGIARLDSGLLTANRQNFIRWTNVNLKTFRRELCGEKFYEDFRCGLVHAAQICNSGIFTYEIGSTVAVEDEVMAVNPKNLWSEVKAALDNTLACWRKNPAALTRVRKVIRTDFAATIPKS